jgi:hypothetical protein
MLDESQFHRRYLVIEISFAVCDSRCRNDHKYAEINLAWRGLGSQVYSFFENKVLLPVVDA